jgi:Uma2 family endonuclease
MSVQQKQTGPKKHRWTRKEFYRLLGLGFFQKLGNRVELIEGTIVRMPPQKNLHSAAIKLTEDVLDAAFGTGHWVRVQMTLDLIGISVVDPDLAVIVGSPHNAPRDNPTTALLVVEVSDTTVSYDRRVKGGIYSAAGIADYWILNLVKRQLEVRRQPAIDPHHKYGHRYASLSILTDKDVVSPLAAPQAQIAVADLLP